MKRPWGSEGVPSGVRGWLGRLKRPEGIRVQRRGRARARLDDYAEALALAEAGEQLLAGGVVRGGEAARGSILVLGHGAAFSPGLAEYALGLASRLGCGLVFLSVGEKAANGDRSSPQMQAFLREGFERKAAEAARAWLLLAGERGIEAAHEVRFGGVVAAVEEVCGAPRRIGLILSEPEEGARIGARAPLALFTVE